MESEQQVPKQTFTNIFNIFKPKTNESKYKFFFF